jgi:hypothetical protein
MFQPQNSIIKKIVPNSKGEIDLFYVMTKEPIITQKTFQDSYDNDGITIKKTDYSNTLLTFPIKTNVISGAGSLANTYIGIRYNPKTNMYSSFQWPE